MPADKELSDQLCACGCNEFLTQKAVDAGRKYKRNHKAKSAHDQETEKLLAKAEKQSQRLCKQVEDAENGKSGPEELRHPAKSVMEVLADVRAAQAALSSKIGELAAIIGA